MFWDSVVAGLKVLTYWETYVAGLVYLAIFFIPMIIVGFVTEKSESGGSFAGCLGMFLLPVLQVAAMVVFLLTLSPIIFGFSEDAAWSFPWKVMTMAPGGFFALVGILIVAAIILTFIPFLGQLNSLHTLILGGITLVVVLGMLDSINPGTVRGRVDFVPGFWFSIGLLVIGGILSWIGILLAALLATGLEMSKEGTGFGQLVMIPIGTIFGFIPVFMYGAWLGAQVKGGF